MGAVVPAASCQGRSFVASGDWQGRPALDRPPPAGGRAGLTRAFAAVVTGESFRPWRYPGAACFSRFPVPLRPALTRTLSRRAAAAGFDFDFDFDFDLDFDFCF